MAKNTGTKQATKKNPPLRLRVGTVNGKKYSFSERQFFYNQDALLQAVRKALSKQGNGLREILISVHD